MEAIADNTFIHPSLSLVSHGAECVVIHKRLFMDYAPLKLLDKLREQVCGEEVVQLYVTESTFFSDSLVGSTVANHHCH